MTEIHQRKQIRLKDYDYSQDGSYFVTICVHNRENVFGEIQNGKNLLNEYGGIVDKQWRWLFRQYKYIQIDEFVVMPNHFHGILHIVGNEHIVGNGRDCSLQCGVIKYDHIKPLPQLIGAFKTTSSKLIHQAGLVNFRWQKSFWDEIIYDEQILNNVRNILLTILHKQIIDY